MTRLAGSCGALWASASPAYEIPVPEKQRTARILLDTDAGNYFDDLFALAYAALSSDAVVMEAVYAAPFVNQRNSEPRKGVERSYSEIRRILEVMGQSGRIPVLKGSPRWMADDGPVKSPAARDMIDRVMAGSSAIDFIVAIGAATTVASALLMEPEIGQRSTVLWLGGTPHSFPSASEFNLRQDPAAVAALFDSGARLMHVPAEGVAENLRASRDELERRMRGKSAIGDHLLDAVSRFRPRRQDDRSQSQTLAVWDMATIAWLVNPDWVESVLTPSPLLGPELVWYQNPFRHRVRVATRLLRDAIWTDFFQKMASAPA